MTTSAKVSNGDYIVSNVSLEGEDVSLSPNQVLLVGTDIDAAFAQVLMAEPADDPRASLIDSELGKRVRAEQQDSFAQTRVIASETPSMERHTGFEKADPLSDPTSGQGANAEPGLTGERQFFADDAVPAMEITDKTGVEGFGDDIASVIAEAKAQEVEMRQEQQAEETATSPAAEQRETAVPKRRKKRIKPPTDEKEKEDPE